MGADVQFIIYLLSLVPASMILSVHRTIHYPNDAFAIVSILGRCALMAKIDLKNAFCLSMGTCQV